MLLRRSFAAVFTFAGMLHFVRPEMYEAIMPDYLPAHRELVYASGVAEMMGGLGVLHPRTRRAGKWIAVLTLIGVFPANLHMALNPDRYDLPGGEAMLWARLPLQLVFIAWAVAAGRDD